MDHECIASPNWDTKINCACGDRFANWNEFYRHRGDRYAAENEKLRRDVDGLIQMAFGGIPPDTKNLLAAENERLWAERDRYRSALQNLMDLYDSDIIHPGDDPDETVESLKAYIERRTAALAAARSVLTEETP